MVPIKKVGLSALERTHFLLEVKAMVKEVHNRRVRLRREMLTKGRVGLFDNVNEIGGNGPADLLQYVDPIIMLVCNEFDLGRVGRGQILPVVMVEEDDDEEDDEEEEEEMPMIDTLKGRLVELARLL